MCAFCQRRDTVNRLILSQRSLCLHGTRHYAFCVNLNDVYILSAARTPIGSFQGQLSPFNAVQLATKTLTAAVEKANVGKDDVQEIIMGCVFQAGLGQQPAHQVAMFAGCSPSIISSCTNRMCGSGLKAVITACQVIATNTHEVVAAGGMECLTHVPYILKRKNMRVGNICVPDMILHDGLNDPFDVIDVAVFAEERAKEFKITREDQDDYALNSYARSSLAQEQGVFSDEIVPIVLEKKDSEEVIYQDEEVKHLNVEKFRELPPLTGKDGTITVGNSSGFSDGAAMLILCSGNYVLKKCLSPLARIVSYAECSVQPKHFLITPSVVVPKALLKANITPDDITRWEIHETFALTPLINMKILKLAPDRVNVYGGGVSLGHPFGMTGGRLLAHLSHTLRSGELGCAVISHTPGGGSAVIVEKL